MPKWTYRLVEPSSREPWPSRISEDQLNELGKEGWEVVSVGWVVYRGGPFMCSALLKKQVDEPKPEPEPHEPKHPNQDKSKGSGKPK